MCLFDARQKRHPSIILADITLTLRLQIRIFPTGSRRRSKCLLQRAMFSFHVLGKLVKSDACFVFLYFSRTERDVVVIQRCLSVLVENSSFKLMSDGQIEFLCTYFCSGFLTEIPPDMNFVLHLLVDVSFAIFRSCAFHRKSIVENWISSLSIRYKLDSPQHSRWIRVQWAHVLWHRYATRCPWISYAPTCVHCTLYMFPIGRSSPPVSILFTQIYYYYIALIWAPKMVTYQPHLCLYLMCPIPDSIAALADETATNSNKIQRTMYHRILFHCFVE